MLSNSKRLDIKIVRQLNFKEDRTVRTGVSLITYIREYFYFSYL